MMGYGGYGLLGGLGMGLGMIVWVALIVLVVWAVVVIGGRATRRDQSPLDMLKHRYAAGEINQAEFEQARQHLT